MDISNLTIEQLKALAYDVISEAEKTQKNLQVINGEIAKKTELKRQSLQKAKSDTTTPLTKEQVDKIENTRGASEPEKTKEDNKSKK